MRLHYLASLALVSAGVAQQAAPSQVSLCVTTSIGVCGSFCEPFQCLPNFTLVDGVEGEGVRCDIGGAPGMMYVLYCGTAVNGCQPYAGFDGALALWAPIITIQIGTVLDAAPPAAANCAAGSAVYEFVLPGNVPLGLDTRFQVLGFDAQNPEMPRLAFSRAVQIRTR